MMEAPPHNLCRDQGSHGVALFNYDPLGDQVVPAVERLHTAPRRAEVPQAGRSQRLDQKNFPRPHDQRSALLPGLPAIFVSTHRSRPIRCCHCWFEIDFEHLQQLLEDHSARSGHAHAFDDLQVLTTSPGRRAAGGRRLHGRHPVDRLADGQYARRAQQAGQQSSWSTLLAWSGSRPTCWTRSAPPA